MTPVPSHAHFVSKEIGVNGMQKLKMHTHTCTHSAKELRRPCNYFGGPINANVDLLSSVTDLTKDKTQRPHSAPPPQAPVQVHVLPISILNFKRGRVSPYYGNVYTPLYRVY